MAKDWIKMRPSLLTSPKVNGMSGLLKRAIMLAHAWHLLSDKQTLWAVKAFGLKGA